MELMSVKPDRYRLAFHHQVRVSVLRAAQAENGGAVGDDGDEVALDGVVVGAGLGSLAIASTGTATPGE